MVNIENYVADIVTALKDRFVERLIYVGLQGSYLRGEANDESDIDIMCILDGLNVSDLRSYRAIVDSMPHADKSCGFICSAEDMKHWNPLEILHLLHSTGDRYGSLACLVPAYTAEDVRNFVKMSINNMYHELCHRYIHGNVRNTCDALPGIFKGVFFILQNKHYLSSGDFVRTKTQLLEQLEGLDYEVMKTSMDMKKGCVSDFEESFRLLFTWCQRTLHAL